MKLSEWARRNGVHYQTAWSWAKNGQMPVPVVKTPTGRYLVIPPDTADTGRTVAYCRVSSADQRADLERQAGRVVAAATARGLTVAEVVSEVGSGLDGNRPELAKLLRDPHAVTIVVEHRDRLARFGVEHLTCALAATGRRIVILDDAEVVDDLVRDMVEVLTSCCARLYGRRSAGRKANAAMATAEATA
ncbi:IS607 family transposase [Dactylosporangium vinaceum]|uniref:IS607 family transposase n=1 Tax=Dactylosporangium vinaceum TaxID=53362 RepID=A0ABV5MIV2_9ACTN|nr:IS607 family transposase [Dactylosporangium vinaceum]UAB93791.1 IS607 family transposase [Dactylosporangium vinaceum]